jgi:hypothetical protein
MTVDTNKQCQRHLTDERSTQQSNLTATKKFDRCTKRSNTAQIKHF